jgi:hypothetical protein
MIIIIIIIIFCCIYCDQLYMLEYENAASVN